MELVLKGESDKRCAEGYEKGKSRDHAGATYALLGNRTWCTSSCLLHDHILLARHRSTSTSSNSSRTL